MFRKLLIANRGEIACRIARTAHRLGVEVAAVYSEADAGARHVRLADEAWPIGPAPASQSYLDGESIVRAARKCGAEAIHPGYGFLAESAAFAERCAAAGIAFVGPPAAAIAAMGDKAAAKDRMRRAGVPVLPGAEDDGAGADADEHEHADEDADEHEHAEASLDRLERRGQLLGFPLMIKPVSGGGGKGMAIVRGAGELGAALEASRRLAESAFGDGRLLLERYLPDARHVEVQVLADRGGQVLHLLDRDCSVQRRHQKLIEEAPAPDLDPPLRAAMAAAACTAAREVAYVGAGTVEFLVEGGKFFFMEMNTRLQVEHGVTEAVTGLDLVEWQLRIAAGEPLTLRQGDIAAVGHAVEVRVCAEDPARDFMPGSGLLRVATWPSSEPAIRVDAGFESGDIVPSQYDSLLGKIIAHAPVRAEAIGALGAALRKTRIAGVPTNVGWLAAILESPSFRAGPVGTEFVSAPEGRAASAGTRAGTRAGARAGARADPHRLARFAAAARVLANLRPRGHDARSPWALADGFRLGVPEPIEVRLRDGSDLSIAEVRVLGPARVEATLSDSGADDAEIIELVTTAERLQGLRSERGGSTVHVLAGEEWVDVWLAAEHAAFRVEPRNSSAGAVRPIGNLTAALPGVVVAVQASSGEPVREGQPLLVVEAMKMEHTLRAPAAGKIGEVRVRVGDRVREGDLLVTMAGD